jgi:hypothetical protein
MMSALVHVLDSAMMRGFFGLPNRGGWFSIFNCAYWAAFVLQSRVLNFLPGIAQGLLYRACSLPLLWPAFELLRRFDGPVPDWPPLALATAVGAAFGLNSLAWGYGLTAMVTGATRLLRIGRKDRFRREGRCVVCGYDLRATPDRCPECGWTATADTRSPMP